MQKNECIMARFQKGTSGNPNGKKIGTLNRKTVLEQCFQKHAEALINKTIELGLSGDPMALRLCIERLVPKAKEKSTTVVIPDISTIETTKIIPELMRSLAGQEITVTDFKSLIEVFTTHDSEVDQHNKKQEKLELNTNDPIEAARAYARFMRRN